MTKQAQLLPSNNVDHDARAAADDTITHHRHGSEGPRIDGSVSSSGVAATAASPSIASPSHLAALLSGDPAHCIQFQANTIAPSPPLAQSPPSVSAAGTFVSHPHGHHALSGHPLRLQTDIYSDAVPIPLSGTSNSTAALTSSLASASSSYTRPSTLVLQNRASNSSLRPGSFTPSFQTTGLHGFGSSSAASSTVPSPIISAMGDVTPLPSPLLSGDSPGPWKKFARSPPRETSFTMAPGAPESALVTANGESVSSVLAHQAKRKAYAELLAGKPCSGQPGAKLSHTRDRSLSEYTPDPMLVPKRMITVSASHVKPIGGPDHVEASYESHMRREPHLSSIRGLTPVKKPPTPPPSDSSLVLGDATTTSAATSAATSATIPATASSSSSDPKQLPGERKHAEYFEAHGREDKKLRRWRAIRLLGQGTFSRVMLATSQTAFSTDDSDEQGQDHQPHPIPPTSELNTRYDRRSLVAVKVCEHGPKGGASEDRVEMSLKRELEIMQSIHHPSLVHLKAWSIEPSRAILVLSYCPGGDLFDVASAHRNLLTPSLLARIFAELVAAVQYLHHMHIVHRDIKLENVLVNLSTQELSDSSVEWATYPYSVTTLTDLGLSRRVADDEKLETRCGSDDYAAPEVIMGQPYDGRATDAWSLGVLLYALLEGRLPFDPNPGMSDAHRMRSRTSHRIARVEWRWIDLAGDDGDHEGDISKFQARGLLGAMDIVEGLLKRARSRWSLDKVAQEPWVQNAMSIEGGLRFRDEEEGEEVC